jgi:hypothetical protein
MYLHMWGASVQWWSYRVLCGRGITILVAKLCSSSYGMDCIQRVDTSVVVT